MKRKDFIKYLRSRNIYNQFMNNGKRDADIKRHFGRKFLTEDDVIKYCSKSDGSIDATCLLFCFLWTEAKEGPVFWFKHNNELYSYLL